MSNQETPYLKFETILFKTGKVGQIAENGDNDEEKQLIDLLRRR